MKRTDRPPQIPPEQVASLGRAILRTAFRLMGGLTVLGGGNVPMHGPALICPNHISDCDPAAIFACMTRRDVYFVAKEELFETPALGTVLRLFGGICIRRDTADRTAIRQIERVLEGGAIVVMFPEGRLSQTGWLGRLQPGAAMIALRTGAPIVPAGLTRTNAVLPYGALTPRRSPLPIRIQLSTPLIPAEGAKGRAAIDALTTELERRIRTLTGQET